MEQLLSILQEEKDKQTPQGVYEWLQIITAFHSCRIEGNATSYQDARFLFLHRNERDWENSYDHTELIEHFQLFDAMLDSIGKPLTPDMIRDYHVVQRDDTEDYEYKNNAKPGEYRQTDGKEVGCPAVDIPGEMEQLIAQFHKSMRAKSMTLSDIAQFHLQFERIHPFPDDNGSIGRILILRQCLESSLAPAVPGSDTRHAYYAAFDAEDPSAALANYLRKEQEVYGRMLTWLMCR